MLALSLNLHLFVSAGLDPGAVFVIVVIVILLVACLVGLVVWLVYAYRHPTSPSGMFLMEVSSCYSNVCSLTLGCMLMSPPLCPLAASSVCPRRQILQLASRWHGSAELRYLPCWYCRLIASSVLLFFHFCSLPLPWHIRHFDTFLWESGTWTNVFLFV